MFSVFAKMFILVMAFCRQMVVSYKTQANKRGGSFS